MKVKILESGTIGDLEHKINLFCDEIESKRDHIVEIKYKIFLRNGIGNIYNAMIIYE